MTFRTLFGSALLVVAATAGAQERGTVEFGAFGSAGRYDNALTLTNGYGGGGRVGMFLDPRIAVEFEKGEMRAHRTLGLTDVNVGILASHLVVTALQSGGFSLHLGAGAGASTETNFLHSYGVNALVGAKIALTDGVAFRVDGISDWLANNDWKSYQRVHVGLSVFRHPAHLTRIVEVVTPAPAYVQRADSVSAEEQDRRRRAAQAYMDLRDSLNRTPAPRMMPAPMPVGAPSSSAVTTMEEKIHFATDRAELSADARAILDAKVLVFRANPNMRISIVGNTDERASDAHNMGLGARRAAAAKAYIVSKGIDASRIAISSDGERNPTAAGTSKKAEAQNRRDEFRLVIM